MTAAVLLACTGIAEGAGVAGPGFAVEDFATGFPTGNRFGPLGIAFDGRGFLYAVDNTDSNLYRFSPVGGPASSSVVSSVPIPGYLVGLAFDKKGDLFVARESVPDGGDVVQIDPGTGAVVRTVASGFVPLGLATDPVSDDLFVTVLGEPVKRISGPGSATPTVTAYGEVLSSPDGIAFGPEGTIYLEDQGEIVSITGTASATPGVNTTLAFVGEADGIAVAETTNPAEQPFLAVNSNDGTITKVDLAANPPSYSTMVTEGSRGDFVAVGPDQCLYATQLDSIEKVTASDGTCPFYPSGPFHCSARVASVSPTSGHVPIGTSPGTSVTIQGRGFCPGTKVEFASLQSTGGVVDANLETANRISAVVPRDAASGPLSLITPEGYRGPAVQFSVNSYRNVSAFSFRNFAAKGDVTWTDVAEAFGENAYQRWSLCAGCKSLEIPSSAASALFREVNADLAGGLCYGFSLGSLRLTAGIDPLAPTAALSHNDPAWSAGSVYALPTYDTKSQFGGQLRHYLYQEAMKQFSAEHYSAIASYFGGLRHRPAGRTAAQYLSGQLANAFSHGLGVIEIFEPGEGHAMVPYDVQAHPDGSFDIGVYDSNQPFSPGEVTDAATHEAALQHNEIHVDAHGNWSYLMRLEDGSGALVDVSWAGRPDQIRVVSLAAMSGPLTPSPQANPAYASVTVGAPVTQITDDKGRKLFDAHGNLNPESDAPEVAVAPPATGVAVGAPTAWTAPTTAFVLRDGREYNEAIGSGTLNVLGAGTDGRVTSAGGDLRLTGRGSRLRFRPTAPQTASLELSTRGRGGQTSVSVAGRLTGALTLALGRSATVEASSPQMLRLRFSRVGPARPPQAFVASVHLRRGERLVLRSLRRLDPSAGRIAVVVKSGRRARTVRLVNRAARPTVRILRAIAKRTRSGTRVTVALAIRAARGGRVVVMVRGARGSAAQIQLRARARVTVHAILKRQPRGRRVRVWAVALASSGQAGRTVKGAPRVR